MNKHKRYRQKCIREGRCPRCGKPCAPYYECEEHRKLKRYQWRAGKPYKKGRPRIKGKTIADATKKMSQLYEPKLSYNKLYYLVTKKGFDPWIWLAKTGDRVELTEEGIRVCGQAWPHKKAKNEGVVVGVCREPQLIKVLRDGIKTPSSYHRSFWKVKLETLKTCKGV